MVPRAVPPLVRFLPRLSKSPPRYSRFAGLLPDSEVILVVDIAESPGKRAFRGVRPHPFVERARLGVLPEGATDSLAVQRGDDHTAPHTEERGKREAVLRGRGGVQPAAVCSDYRAHIAG